MFHGTWVAGVAGAKRDNGIFVAGVASGARIVVKNNTGPAPACTIDVSKSVFQIQKAADSGAAAINMSYGGVGPLNFSIPEASAVAYAYRMGVVNVASSGNEGCICVAYPAGYTGVIAVAATDKVDVDWSHANGGNHLDLAAPGVDIVTTSPAAPGYAILPGTSFSAPQVAGLAALLRSRDNWPTAPSTLAGLPALPTSQRFTNDDIEWLMKFGADDVNFATLPGRDSLLGYGRINIRKTFKLLDDIQAGTLAWIPLRIPGGTAIADGQVILRLPDRPLTIQNATRYKVEREVTSAAVFPNFPLVYPRKSTVGWDSSRTNFEVGWLEVISVNARGWKMRTYVFQDNSTLQWYPTSPANVQFDVVVITPPYFTPDFGLTTKVPGNSNQIQLNWENAGATNYYVERQESPTSPWVTLDTLPGSQFSYIDGPSLVNPQKGSHTYNYRIRSNTGLTSNESSSKTFPNPPNITSATVHLGPECHTGGEGMMGPVPPPGPNLVPTNQIDISWATDPNQDVPIALYQVRFDHAGTPTYLPATTRLDTTLYPLNFDADYTIYGYAYDQEGNLSRVAGAYTVHTGL